MDYIVIIMMGIAKIVEKKITKQDAKKDNYTNKMKAVADDKCFHCAQIFCLKFYFVVLISIFSFSFWLVLPSILHELIVEDARVEENGDGEQETRKRQ